MSAAKAMTNMTMVTKFRRFFIGRDSFRGLEVEVLQGVRGAAVERQRRFEVALPAVQIALRHPRGRHVADGSERLVEPLGRSELLHPLVEARLLDQRAAENEVRVPALLDVVAAVVQDRKRVTG